MTVFEKVMVLVLCLLLSGCGCYLCRITTTDRDITENIQAQYASEATLKYMNIDVSVFNRQVILRGIVENPIQLCVAIQIAKATPCVQNLQSRITIKSDPNWPEPDSMIFPKYCYPYLHRYVKNW